MQLHTIHNRPRVYAEYGVLSNASASQTVAGYEAPATFYSLDDRTIKAHSSDVDTDGAADVIYKFTLEFVEGSRIDCLRIEFDSEPPADLLWDEQWLNYACRENDDQTFTPVLALAEPGWAWNRYSFRTDWNELTQGCPVLTLPKLVNIDYGEFAG